MAKDDNTGAEIVPIKAVPRFSDEQLRDITSVDDALELLRAQFGDRAVTRIDDVLGTGFVLADDRIKDQLVGEPMYLLAWTFNPGDYRDTEGKLRDFVTVALITVQGRKVILNDGSTGICAQLSQLTNDKGIQNGLEVPHGLRKSDYKIGANPADPETFQRPVPRDYDGPTEPAVTYYLDTSS